MGCGLVSLALTGAAHAQAAAAPAPVAEVAQATLPAVEIVGTTPVPGTGVPKDQIPANVQTADDRKLRRSQATNLPDFLATQMPSVNINETQGNPFQMDVNYRGYTASPLLGTPQGLSVFLDGVRINEPFGDVVNWDLIPTAAIANVTLIPGSNPLFGLNTLGGALSMQTKSGDTHPGGEVEIEAGSWGRIAADATYGTKLGEHGHLFVALSSFDENGWRDYSPSRLRQAFVKGGVRQSDLSWDVSLLQVDSKLVGNGLLPESMLAVGRSQIYTRPDQTENHTSLVTFNGKAMLNDRLELSGTAYLRRARQSTVNGDLNDDFDPEEDPLTGVDHETRTTQDSEGLALQLSGTFGAHRLLAGISYDRSRSHFEQTSAEGNLDATRGVVVTEPTSVDALISGHGSTTSFYASDLWTLAPNLQLTLSGRYNDTRSTTVDDGRAQLGLDTALDGSGRYTKFNPAAGLTWQVTPDLTAYGGYSQGNRAPSPIELGCADPNNACILPNALQGDPPLKQVVSRTIEAGLRGNWSGLRWNASTYRTVNTDDLLFISNGHAAGYFANAGRTLRQGVELSLAQRSETLDWSIAYSYLRATFDSTACLLAASNSSAGTSSTCTGDDEIAVQPGDRLPGLPQHSLKFNVDWKVLPDWSVGAQLSAYSSQYARGNENNQQTPDNVDFFGSGKVGGYAVLNLTTNWKVAKGLELYAKVTNVLDRKYATSALLAENAFDPHGTLLSPDQWRQEQFVGPGAPRGAFVGVRYSFD
ncbi:MAG: TonB-dependent receptor [Proteobacteria bacterium]|nr:TonB-dependent receptor [Pseudomonadota bacterium]